MATRSLLRPTSLALRSISRQARVQVALPRLQPAVSAANASPSLVRFKSSKGKGKSKSIPASEVESSSQGVSAEESAGPLTEAYDGERMEENMKRSVARAKETANALVGSFGRVDPSLLDSVRVQQAGEKGPGYALREVATVGVRDGSLMVSCFDAEMSKSVEKAIYAAELGLAPQASGEEGVLRVPVPKPTSETRATLQKDVSKILENARASIRAARHTARDGINSDKKRKIVGTDEAKKDEKKVEEASKKYTSEVDAFFEQIKKRME